MLFTVLLMQHTVYNQVLTPGNLTLVESILEICSVELGEGGNYTCNATNGFTGETNTIIVTVIDNRGECVSVYAFSYMKQTLCVHTYNRIGEVCVCDMCPLCQYTSCLHFTLLACKPCAGNLIMDLE